MKLIPLTQGKFTKVDDSMFDELNKYKWFAKYEPRTDSFTAGRKISGIGKYAKQRGVYMHREIMNAPAEMEVDHIDHDTLNNQIDNLRLCTPMQNKRNRKMYSNNTSGYKGVSKEKGKWLAYIMAGGKLLRLGLFQEKVDAAKAYNKAASELHGEFALLNIISDN